MFQSAVTKSIIITFLLITDVRNQNTRPFLNTYVSIAKAPYITYIRTEKVVDDEDFTYTECTGSIIDKNYVLTLATCVNDIEDTSSTTYVYGGLEDYNTVTENQENDFGNQYIQKRQMQEVIKHPRFKSNRLGEANLALIKVDRPFELCEEVSPIPLDAGGWPMVDQRPDRQRSCEVIGFGYTNYKEANGRLKSHSVKAYHDDSCACAKRTQWMSLVCLDQLEDVGLCKEYDGAPLICSGKGVAINQLLVARANCSGILHPENICGDYTVVSFFLYLCPFLSWMKETVKTVPDQPKYCDNSPRVHRSNYTLLLLLTLCTCFVQYSFFYL